MSFFCHCQTNLSNFTYCIFGPSHATFPSSTCKGQVSQKALLKRNLKASRCYFYVAGFILKLVKQEQLIYEKHDCKGMRIKLRNSPNARL